MCVVLWRCRLQQRWLCLLLPVVRLFVVVGGPTGSARVVVVVWLLGIQFYFRYPYTHIKRYKYGRHTTELAEMTLSIEIRWLNKRKEAIQTFSVGLSAGLKSLSNRLLQAFAHKALIGCFWSRFLIITVPYSPRTIILFLYAIARSSFVAGRVVVFRHP